MPTLLQALQNPVLYKHPINYFKIIETHISYVLLTGEFAYKIKKPLSLGFLDFSTLEKRKLFCEKEFQLNRQFTDTIYLDILPICGSIDTPNLENQGDVIEYAIKMREFPQETLLTALLKRHALTHDMISQLAKIIANFHLKASVATNTTLGTSQQIHKPVEQNFLQIRPLLSKEPDIQQLSRVERWANSQYQQHYDTLLQRKTQGFIRACHGDIHLENIIFYHDTLHIFDCIEFNEEFRWIDVISDISFLIMDLMEKNCEEYAHRLMNEYFEITKDYAGLKLLFYYVSYRAVVRAKVSLFRLQQAGLSASEKQTLLEMYKGCMALAEKYTNPPKPILYIMHGVSASGKSTLAKAFAIKSGAIQIRSDIERKHLFSEEDLENIYSIQATEKTYAHLAYLSETIINAGFSVIVDAAFLKRSQRAVFEKLAQELKIPFVIISCQAPDHVLKKSLIARQQEKKDPSEATLDVLEMQLNTHEPLADIELEKTIVVKTHQDNEEKIILDLMNKIF